MEEGQGIGREENTKRIVYWDDIEKNGLEEYDEAFLAMLRSDLKNSEKSLEKVLLIPKRFSGQGSFWGYADSEIMSEEKEVEFFEIFTACMLHVARRVKDCKNVIGFAYPDFENDWNVLKHYENEHKEKFMAAFQKKHSHYIFVE